MTRTRIVGWVEPAKPNERCVGHHVDTPGASLRCTLGFGATRLNRNLREAVTTPRVPVMIRSQRGMTLVELVISIVIIGIAAAALFSAIASITARSADPMLRQQSLMIAESYLETLLVADLASYPDLIPSGEEPRGIDKEPIPELSAYRVTAVAGEAELGPAGNQVDAVRIDVSVTDPAGQTLTLTGYRTDY